MQPSSNKLMRRDWLRSAAALALAAGGCGQSDDSTFASRRQLKVFNWSDYIHESVVPRFEREHDCTVIYDNYSSDSELETRLASGAGAYDVVFPSDRAMTALVAKGLLAELDPSRLANFRHLDPKFLAPPFDRENRFSVPYFWGTLALGVRTDFVDSAAKGLEVLFDPRFRG